MLWRMHANNYLLFCPRSRPRMLCKMNFNYFATGVDTLLWVISALMHSENSNIRKRACIHPLIATHTAQYYDWILNYTTTKAEWQWRCLRWCSDALATNALKLRKRSFGLGVLDSSMYTVICISCGATCSNTYFLATDWKTR